ncbi:MAG: Abi family protein [Treponema sp.]|jgi:abortive infection bacteriophage resistance protein|nr:Abi family protein [Treponema sp.]
MAKQPYTKPPLPVQEQINLLKSRGLRIPDEPKAIRYFQNISYYRLSGYMYPFLADVKQHRYKEGAAFEDIFNLYRFDRELRLLVFSAIEKIEIAFRARIINQYSTVPHNPFWYTDSANFADPKKHAGFLNTVTAYISRSNDVFIKHFYTTYSDPWPPIWVLFEILPMGQLSILYSITANSPARKAIADYFGVKAPVLTAWIHTLVYVRNICAHHARLWNKELRVPARLPKKTANKWLAARNISGRKAYIVLAIIIYLLDTITPQHGFRQEIKDLMAKYPKTDRAAMGFPQDWLADPFWVQAEKGGA